MGDGDTLQAPGHDHRPLQHVAQLADVPGPRILEQTLKHVVVEVRRRVDEIRPQLLDQPRDELEQILARPRPQRRQVDRHHAQPIVQILTELPVRHFTHEIFAGGGDEPHVGRYLARATQAAEALALEDAQQLWLKQRIQVANLVEEQRSALSDVEQPRAERFTAVGLGELLTEKFRVECAAGERRTVDLDEWPLATGTRAVDRFGDVALPRSALARDEHGRPLAPREQLDLRRELTHRCRCAEQRRRRQAAAPVREVAVHLAQLRLF